MKAGNLVSSSHGIVAAELGTRAHRLGCGEQHTADGGCGPIVVIDRHEQARSYLVGCLEEATDGTKVVAFASGLQWLQVAEGYPQPKVVLICDSSRDNPEREIIEDLSLLADLTDAPVIALPIVARDGPALVKRSTSQKAEKQGDAALACGVGQTERAR